VVQGKVGAENCSLADFAKEGRIDVSASAS
jgi:hypothetical protein